MVGRHAYVGPHSYSNNSWQSHLTQLFRRFKSSFNVEADMAFHVLLGKELITHAFETYYHRTRLLSHVTPSQAVRHWFLTYAPRVLVI